MFWLLQLSEGITSPYTNDGSPTEGHTTVSILTQADTPFFKKSLFWGFSSEDPQKFGFAGTSLSYLPFFYISKQKRKLF